MGQAQLLAHTSNLFHTIPQVCSLSPREPPFILFPRFVLISCLVSASKQVLAELSKGHFRAYPFFLGGCCGWARLWKPI